MNKSTNYTGRQSDLCFVTDIDTPVTDVTEAGLGIAVAPKRVTGIQKALQRYVNLMTTRAGSIEFAPSLGSILADSVHNGTASNESYLNHIFAVASADALDAMTADDANTDAYGEPLDDEIIVSADLVDIIIDYGTSTISLEVEIANQAGDSAEFIIPMR